jgi:hypothetical protein
MYNNFKTSKIRTAVLFLVFNRPDTTTKVFQMIRQAKPPRLYVAADGARNNKEGEEEEIAKVREIATKVDWPCDVKTLFRDKNLGCKKAISDAITWFFEYEEQGIILEDDCLPHLDFFNFCENLLDYYSKDEKVTSITGDNFQNGQRRGDASYYFSIYNHCWGWATWKRAWKHYQVDLSFWPTWSKSDAWLKHTPDKTERKFWNFLFNQVRAGKIDTWDYQWTGSAWYQNGLTATPNVNLVSNIGFGANSTHTKDANQKAANMPSKEIGILKHPKMVMRNVEADRLVFDYHYGGKKFRFPYNWIIFPSRVLRYFYRMFKKLKI